MDSMNSIGFITYCFEMKILQIIRKIKLEIENYSQRRGKINTVQNIFTMQRTIVEGGVGDNHDEDNEEMEQKISQVESIKDVANAVFMVINHSQVTYTEIKTLYWFGVEFRSQKFSKSIKS